MIIVLKENTKQEERNNLMAFVKGLGVQILDITGERHNVFGLVGDTSKIDIDLLRAQAVVEDVKRVQEPFKACNRKFHPDDSVINVDGKLIGGGHVQVMAGPCSIENEDQIIETAEGCKAAGATMLRGGAFKPRTSPYAFQGLHASGIELLLKAKKATGLPIVTEIMAIEHLDLFADVDLIQVGARNMQNFELLKALGQTKKPILLKRGLANTMEELLMSAEYIMAGGNPNVILCERGIRTFETKTRNTLDIAAIPLLHQLSHLPITVDPSHATGIPTLVEPLALASIACGADAIMIEVHNNPSKALSDGAQSLTPAQFKDVMDALKKQITFSGKVLG